MLAHLSQDPNLLNAYAQGKDLYAWMAAIVYNLPYEQCLEFDPSGTENPDGKIRRDSMKILVLALMYGRGVSSTAAQLGVTKKRAQEIIDTFFNEFPRVKETIHYYQDMARQLGYVKTVYGRKRRLPDIRLDPYVFTFIDSSKGEVDDVTKSQLYSSLSYAFSFEDRGRIKAQAKENGIRVIDNTVKIADAERQCLNSVIQGTAADITKIAMLAIARDEKMLQWGAKMILTVHDEIIIEVAEQYAFEAAEHLGYLMVASVADTISVPMGVDLEVSTAWTGENLLVHA